MTPPLGFNCSGQTAEDKPGSAINHQRWLALQALQGSQSLLTKVIRGGDISTEFQLSKGDRRQINRFVAVTAATSAGPSTPRSTSIQIQVSIKNATGRAPLLQGFFSTGPNVAHPALASLLRKRPVEIRHGFQRSLPPGQGTKRPICRWLRSITTSSASTARRSRTAVSCGPTLLP